MNEKNKGDKPKTEKMIFKAANKENQYYRDCLKREFIRFKAELIVAVELGFITLKQAKKLSNVTYTETPEIEVPVKEKLEELRKFFKSPEAEKDKQISDWEKDFDEDGDDINE